MILKLKDVFINELPTAFKYNGSIDCSESSLERLPKNLFIKGDLILIKSKITTIPEGAVIIGNVYSDKKLVIDNSALIQGYIQENQKKYFYDTPKHVIYTDDKKRIVFKTKWNINQYSDPIISWYYPALAFYKSINEKDYAVQYTEKNKTFCLSCSSVEDGKLKVDWHRAEQKGINLFKDLDIYEERSVKELKAIYETCTSCCAEGPDQFIKEFNIDINKKYSINDLREMVLITKLKPTCVHVFLDYFDPEKRAL